MTDQEALNSLTAMKTETDTVKSEIIDGYTELDEAINELELSYSIVAGRISDIDSTVRYLYTNYGE